MPANLGDRSLGLTRGDLAPRNWKDSTVTIWDYFVWFFWFYIALSCLWIFITLLADVFRDDSLSGVAKALWALFLVFVPFLAAVVYIIVRRGSMAARTARDQEVVADSEAASPSSEIESAKRLLDSGAVTAAEYEVLKSKALASPA